MKKSVKYRVISWTAWICLFVGCMLFMYTFMTGYVWSLIAGAVVFVIGFFALRWKLSQ